MRETGLLGPAQRQPAYGFAFEVFVGVEVLAGGLVVGSIDTVGSVTCSGSRILHGLCPGFWRQDSRPEVTDFARPGSRIFQDTWVAKNGGGRGEKPGGLR